ncbi:autotransporter-associated beta strand repeat-containing protein [Verrucomicrobiaceae bacterium N1E253]|uniref:Autotransporter-associated beta strand repeat-containing protein n=1 Tax=Oceaniferula marina TaxID=2748318 RepID=A0A851GHZ0_9BACT|nr:autotransporter-associated beta strand repeat-containing protein [Oceaniferula marina]NWK56512.1 autotransporter-associated beta strand repeat-containing protein [Oceaniferula marina]
MNHQYVKKNGSALLIFGASLVASLGVSAQDSISVNFGADRNSSVVEEASKKTGAVLIDGDKWNNTAVNGSGSLAGLIDSNGAATFATVNWTARNTYRSGSTGATDTSENGDLTTGYLDDGDGGWNVDFSSPYLLNDIYVIHATDQGNPANMSVVSVNGTYYKGDGSGGTILASGSNDSWSAVNWTNADTLTESDHYLKIEDQVTVSLSALNSSPGRAAIAGLQVVDAYSGTLSYWDTNGTTTGSGDTGGTWGTDNFWSASETGEAATGSWASGNAAVFSAGTDGTGTHTITLSGAQTADAVWAKDGDITLAGDALNLTGSGIVRADAASSLTVNSAITGSDGLRKIGEGTVSIGTRATYTGGTVIDGGTLNLTGGGGSVGTLRGAVTINDGATLQLSTGDATGYGTGNRIDSITINGGTLHIDDGGGNQTFSNMALTMKGGTISSAGDSFDYFNGSTSLTTLASDETSTVSTASRLRQTNTTFTVADGAAEVDLLVSGALRQDGGTRNMIKEGDGLMQMTGSGTYAGTTTVNGGTLKISSEMRSSSSFTVNSGATLELGATNVFTAGHGSAMGDGRVITVNGGTLQMNSSFDSRFGNVTLNDGATWTSDRGVGSYDALLANTDAGAATVTVGGSGASTMNGTGGIHLQGVQNFDVADTTGDSAADLTVSMTLANKGSAGGADGGIFKSGAGTMRVEKAATFAGALTVDEGVYEAAAGTSGSASALGAGSATNTVTVNSGAQLLFSQNRGAGYHAADVTINGGTITFNSGDNSLASGKTLRFDTEAGLIDGTGQWRLRDTGNKVVVTAAASGSQINVSNLTMTTSGGGLHTFDVEDGLGTLDLVVNSAIGAHFGGEQLVKDGAGTMRLNGVNTYSGDTTINDGRFELGNLAELRFDIGNSGVNNQLLGAVGGTESLFLDGVLTFDLAAAGTNLGDSWQIVDVANLDESYGSNFGVKSLTGGTFADNSGLWQLDENGVTYQYSELTGSLSVVPEPGSLALLGLGAVSLLFRRRL